MANFKQITFDSETWELGHRGTLGAAFHRHPYIQNLRIYPDGSLGPRPRWKRWAGDIALPGTPPTLGGAPTDTVIPAMQRDNYTSTINYGYLVSQIINPYTFFVYYNGTTTVTVLASGLAPGVAGPFSWVSRIGAFQWLVDDNYITMVGASLIAADGSAALQTRFGGALTYNFQGSAVHQGRGYYWGPLLSGGNIPQNENRIYYSDEYNYATFTSASQFFDVDGPVAGCASIGSSLLIWTEAGEWFTLQGRGDPADSTLNSLGRGRIPENNRQPARYDNVLIFRSSDQTATVVVGESGEMDDRSLAHMAIFTESQPYYGIEAPAGAQANSVNNTIILPLPNNTLFGCHHQYRGVWTLETWGVPQGDRSIPRLDEAQNQESLLVNESLGGLSWSPFYREINLSAPEQDDPSFAFAEDPLGQLILPRIWEPDSQVRVSRIIVDGKSWKDGSLYRTPNITCSTADGDGNTLAFNVGPDTTELTDLPAGQGSAYRLTFTPSAANALTSFSSVRFDNITSMSIERVTVEYEVSDQELMR